MLIFKARKVFFSVTSQKDVSQLSNFQFSYGLNLNSVILELKMYFLKIQT